MITEDYVSFETAKLLEEKGFVGDYTRRYSLIDESDWQGDNRVELSVGDIYSSEIIYIKESIPCPTLQMAMKWLRETHEIFIRPNISFLYPIRYYCEIFCYGDNLSTQQDVTTENFESPEEACEAAIKYCLEHLI